MFQQLGLLLCTLFATGTVMTEERYIFDILFVSTPFKGHFVPMINVGEALQYRGHNVSVINFSYDDFETLVTEREMNFISIGNLPIGKKERDELYKKSIEFDMDAFLRSLT